jgi:hypothetical protein
VDNTNPNCGVIIFLNQFIYIYPRVNWFGTSDVTIKVSDGYLTDTDTFQVTVNPVNDPPVISGLPDRSLNEDTSLDDTIDLWAYTLDVETADSGLTFSIVGNTNINCGVSIDGNRYIDISPVANWYGTSDVTIQVSDGDLTAMDTFQITVNPVNDTPTVVADNTQIAVNEGSIAGNTGTFNDIDQGDLVAITPSIGTITQTGTQAGTWNWSFSTTDGPVESQIVTITATDSGGEFATTSFDLVVNNVPPIVNAGVDQTASEGDAVIFSGSV